jgi:hypothetical protein
MQEDYPERKQKRYGRRKLELYINLREVDDYHPETLPR